MNSSPVVVGAPVGQYSDATDPGYEAYKAAQAARKKMVYVGANDGMLHAFDEATGTEVWAYVPSFAFDATPDKGLAMLAKKEPFFKHQMFVDSTPVVADVDIGGDLEDGADRRHGQGRQGLLRHRHHGARRRRGRGRRRRERPVGIQRHASWATPTASR